MKTQKFDEYLSTGHIPTIDFMRTSLLETPWILKP